jgi:hypothetical protein
MGLMSGPRHFVLKCYAPTRSTIAGCGYRRDRSWIEAQGGGWEFRLLAARVLDKFNRSKPPPLAGYSPGNLLENVPVEFCDTCELASNSESTEPNRLRVGNASVDGEGALIDIEHP